MLGCYTLARRQGSLQHNEQAEPKSERKQRSRSPVSSARLCGNNTVLSPGARTTSSMEFITDISVIVHEEYFKDPVRLEKILKSYSSEKKTSGYTVRGTFEELENLSTRLSEVMDRADPGARRQTRPQVEHASPHVKPVDVSGFVMAYIQKTQAEKLEKIQGSNFSIETQHEPGTGHHDSRSTARVIFRSCNASSLPVHADLVRQRFVTFYQRTASDLQLVSFPASPQHNHKDLWKRFPDLLFEHDRNGGELTVTGPFVHVAKLKEFLSQSTPSSSKSPVDGAPANTPSSGTSSSVCGKGPEEDLCPICIEPMETTEKETLRCKHSFCKSCLKRAFDYKPVCPTCGELYGALTGTQPDGGQMEVNTNASSLPGYEKYGTITICYYIPSGIQKDEHPSPRQPYEGTYRVAYLPDSSEGRRTLALLRRAFDQKLIFTVGQSTTSGRNNMVTWNDIHHKTSTHGGPTRYGYPDADYLSRVQDELKAKGIE
ncbi:E3 ubiquitin-protein ligase DTX3L [Cyclopterus lumpus]|uniref:E3 ubiquitin-protein ligase n=1 Tax=Cyclopterus lumpus TaxID=8103 RepID=A0A8C2YZH0_CYCLU|nr:E3 ubiquitin-protein ligase DTX3L [Cyclopterus lumpus]